MKLYGIDISEKIEIKNNRNLFKVFPWQVIDKRNASYHPLWFKTFDDLVSFYRNRDFMWKNNANDLRIIRTDDSGKEIERYSFEI